MKYLAKTLSNFLSKFNFQFFNRPGLFDLTIHKFIEITMSPHLIFLFKLRGETLLSQLL